MTKLEPGLLFDANMGKYQQPRIVALAMEHGFDSGLPIEEVKEAFSYSTEDGVMDGDDWLEIVADAEAFLMGFAPENHWVGYDDNGDFGVWELEKEEEPEPLPTLEDVIGKLSEKTYLYEIGRGDEIDLVTQGEAFEKHMEEDRGWEPLEEMMDGWEPNEDWWANTSFEKFEDRFEDDAAFEEWKESLWDEVLEEVRERDCSTPIKDLLKNSKDLMVRVSLGCDMPPALYVDFYEYSDELREVIDGLNINPAEFKRVALEMGLECRGRWPKKNRTGVVNPKFLIREMLNTSYFSALTILVKVDIYAMLQSGKKEFVADKGCIVGFHNSSCGSSSPFDAELLADLKLGKNWSFTPDTKGHGYSTHEVFGQRLQTNYITPTT